MTGTQDGELAQLAKEIINKRRDIDDQEVLVSVLEQDGHDVSDYRNALARERSNLALKIVLQFRLQEAVTAGSPDNKASS